MSDVWTALCIAVAISCFTLFIISVIGDRLRSKNREKEEKELLEEIFGNKTE
jgi:hypothetical protein